MAQVITRDNMPELIEKGRVAEFVAPKPEGETKDGPKAEQPGEVKTAAAEQPAAATEEAQRPAVDDELPEKVQKRINEKHRQMKEAEEWGRAQYLEKMAAEKRAEELEREIAELKKSTTPAPDRSEPQEPKQEDFATVAEYIDALSDYKVEQKIRQREEKQAADNAKAEADRLQSAHVERIKKFAATTPDYDEVLAKADLVLAMPVLQFIRESDLGPQMALHLSRDKLNGGDLAERISGMSPIKALAEMGKLEAKLATPKDADEPKPKANLAEQSRAPAPITPIDGKKSPAQKDPATMTFKELRAYNEEQRRLKAQKGRVN